MTKATAKTSATKLRQWVSIAGSLENLAQDIESMTTSELRKKYGRGFSSNKSFEGTLRRVKVDVNNARISTAVQKRKSLRIPKAKKTKKPKSLKLKIKSTQPIGPSTARRGSEPIAALNII